MQHSLRTACYVGFNYSPCDRCEQPEEAAPHPPPPQVIAAGVAEGTPCTIACQVCRENGCDRCKDCCLHYDYKDGTLTVGAMFQQWHSDHKNAAWLCLGEHAYAMKGGLSFIFDGRRVLHGVWSPEGERKAEHEFRSMVIVGRTV